MPEHSSSFSLSIYLILSPSLCLCFSPYRPALIPSLKTSDKLERELQTAIYSFLFFSQRNTNHLSQERKGFFFISFFPSPSVPCHINNNVFAGQRASRTASLQTSIGSVAVLYFWSLSITCIFQAVQLNMGERKKKEHQMSGILRGLWTLHIA